MKSIFRCVNIGILAAAMLIVGAVAASAQDPCVDADGQTKLGDQVRALYSEKTIEGKQKFVDASKQFLEKYGSCESAKDLSDYVKTAIPRVEGQIKSLREAKQKAEVADRFNKALSAKNWDEVYAAGQDAIAKYPEDYRAAELVLGSIGYDENFKTPPNTKYNDLTLRWAKQSLADLQSGKTFNPYGVAPFLYKGKDDAIAWMNLTIGYILAVDKKDKAAALPYLYSATQATGSDTAKNANAYQQIGLYYFDALNKLVEQIKTAEAAQSDKDTPEVAQKKVDDIKALVAMANGTAERAMDAFARAANFGTSAAYKATMHKNVEDAYKLRFGKTDGVDAWIAANTSKPFVNPTTPIQPISDPEPAKTDVATPAKPVAGKPGTTPAKPSK